jgi:hypothetical protein
MDGPFYAIKRANPYFQAEYRKDRALGPTFEDRLNELDKLESQLPKMDPAQQAEWASEIEQIIRLDPSSELRSRAVLTVATVNSESAVRALNAASTDEVEKVRLAACKAWKLRGDATSRAMLINLATKADETTSVRQAAIESLSAFEENEVKETLTVLLDDRSPAIQYQVAQSLQKMTGADYGGDFESWKEYMAGLNPPLPEPKSMTTKVWESLPMLR